MTVGLTRNHPLVAQQDHDRLLGLHYKHPGSQAHGAQH